MADRNDSERRAGQFSVSVPEDLRTDCHREVDVRLHSYGRESDVSVLSLSEEVQRRSHDKPAVPDSG